MYSRMKLCLPPPAAPRPALRLPSRLFIHSSINPFSTAAPPALRVRRLIESIPAASDGVGGGGVDGQVAISLRQRDTETDEQLSVPNQANAHVLAWWGCKAQPQPKP